MGASYIVDYIMGKMSHYIGTAPNSATDANRAHVYVYNMTFLTHIISSGIKP